jgi:glycosyl transferase family 25
MKRFVINLKRRPDRLEQFFQRCPYPRETLEVIEAFDGKFPLNESKKERKLLKKFPSCRQPGAVGCSISHLRIWKKMINENIPIATIFEDDALFDESFTQFMEMEFPPQMKILYFGGRFEKNFVVPPQAMIPVNDKIYIHNNKAWNNKFHERTTHGYILTNELAKFLIELFNISDHPQPVDQFIIHCLRDLNIPVHSTLPLVCWSPIVGDSDIR